MMWTRQKFWFQRLTRTSRSILTSFLRNSIMIRVPTAWRLILLHALRLRLRPPPSLISSHILHTNQLSRMFPVTRKLASQTRLVSGPITRPMFLDLPTSVRGIIRCTVVVGAKWWLEDILELQASYPIASLLGGLNTGTSFTIKLARYIK